MKEVPNLFKHESDEMMGVKAAPVEAAQMEAPQNEARVPKAENVVDFPQAPRAESAAPNIDNVIQFPNVPKVEANAAEARPENAAAMSSAEAQQARPERLSHEERGRQAVEYAKERIGSFKDRLFAGAGRIWDRIKAWPGKAARFAGGLAVKGGLIMLGAGLNKAEAIKDGVSELYTKGVEKWNKGIESLEKRAEAAGKKLEGAIFKAADAVRERMAKIREAYATYMKDREDAAKQREALKKAEAKAAGSAAGFAKAIFA